MTLISSKQKLKYQWNAGDLISPREAAELLGYKSAMQFRDPARLINIVREFKVIGCELTIDIFICGRRRFLRSEIEKFISEKVGAAKHLSQKKQKFL